jgi:GNAT superfamily N-acetyltransferase
MIYYTLILAMQLLGGQTMQMKTLNERERKLFYHNYLTQDFHKSEVKSYKLLEQLVSEGKYLCLGFFEEETPMGYAYLTKSKDEKIIMLDYFAVVSSYRSQGFGTRFLKELINRYKQKFNILIAEVENPRYGTNQNDILKRNRRIDFYRNVGFITTDIQSKILTDEYLIIKIDFNSNISEVDLMKQLNQMYQTIFGEEFYKEHISVRIN